MSREWARDAFAPAGLAPRSFVPEGFATDELVQPIDPARLAERMRTIRPAFEAVELGRRGGGGGFVAGSGLGGLARAVEPVPAAAPQARAEPMPSPPPVVRELEPEPAPPAIDPQAIYDAGLAEGQRRAAIASAADADACAKLLVSAAGASRFDRDGLARRLRQTVLHLVSQLVGETGISPERLGSRVDEAVRMLADVTEPARLSLHPEDLAMMQGRLASNIAAVPDPAMERGGFRLETLSATVEDGPTLWLAQLEAALDRVAAPGE